MKKIKFYCMLSILQMGVTLFFAQAMEIKGDAENPLIVRVVNDNIGPTVGGDFLKDQKLIVDHCTLHKKATPGSGLFGVMHSGGEVRAYPLFNLVPSMTAYCSNGKIIRSMDHSQQPLGLPGESFEIRLPVESEGVKLVTAELKVVPYTLRNIGRKIWEKSEVPLESLSMLTAKEITSSQGSFKKITVAFSWRRLRYNDFFVGNEDDWCFADEPFVRVLFDKENVQQLVPLDPDWKRTVGIARDPLFLDQPDCALTLGFSIAMCGSRRVVKNNPIRPDDVLDLGDKFSVYAGHS